MIRPDQNSPYSCTEWEQTQKRINPLVNENDDDFQYTLPSSPIFDPVNWCIGEWSKDDSHIAYCNYISKE